MERRGVAANHPDDQRVLTIADVDQGPIELRGPSRGTTGSNNYAPSRLAADGHWSYSADKRRRRSTAGRRQSITDSFTAVSSDGTASQLVTVTINGTNDVPVLGGSPRRGQRRQ